MKFNKKAFSLIELMIVLTILVVVLTLAYAPYNYYQNKAKLKIATREVSQSFYEARNMAVSGIKDIDGNRSIGIYLERGEPNNEFITFFSYPHDIEPINILNYADSDIKIIKKRQLQKGVTLKELEGKDNLLLFFEAITGKTHVYTFDSAGKHELSDNEIDLKISYRDSDSLSLQKDLVYYINTNIVDYK